MLGRLSILTKILSIIVLLSGATAAVGLVGYDGLGRVAEATDEVNLTAVEMRGAGRLNAAAVALNRAEYRLAAFPQSVGEVAPQIEASLAEMGEELAGLRASAGPEQAKLLSHVSARFDTYGTELHRTLELAREKAAEVEVSDAQMAILQVVRGNREEVEALREALDGYTEFTDVKGNDIAEAAAALAADSTLTLAVVALVGTLLGLALGFLVAKTGIVDPVRRITAALERLAGGNLEAAIPETGRRDEVGAIARTTLTFQENLKRTRDLEAEAEAQEQRAAEQRRKDMMGLADRFDAQVGSVLNAVSQAATELQATAQQLAAAVEETGAQSTTVAAAAEQASANVQTVASAAEELSSSIAEVNTQVSGTARQSKEASDGARSAQSEIEELGRAIELVEAVIGGINEVAEQTNLLALNATIEAARAGDAGKGFAVVASEVKSLANQTKAMTDEVQAKVDTVRLSSNKAIQAMTRIIEQVRTIDEATAAMAAAVEQQSVATGDISRNASEAATGTTEVSSNISGVQTATTQTREATTIVSESADRLASESAKLQEAVGAFLSEVRAA